MLPGEKKKRQMTWQSILASWLQVTQRSTKQSETIPM
jgi:hypothetical protein